MTEKFQYYRLSIIVFRFFAPFYNAMFWLLTFGFSSKLRDEVVAFSNQPKASRILDVATGTGEQAFAFAKGGFDVVGVDISKDMIHVARKKNKNRKVKFEVVDATELSFEDNSFDASLVSFGLHDMIETIREKVLREMVRVTKKNGTIIIVDYNLPTERIVRSFVYNFVRLWEIYYPEFIKSDLEFLLRKSGIEIKERRLMFFRVVRILKGINTKKIEEVISYGKRSSL